MGMWIPYDRALLARWRWQSRRSAWPKPRMPGTRGFVRRSASARQHVSDTVIEFAGWVVATGITTLSFAIIDKPPHRSWCSVPWPSSRRGAGLFGSGGRRSYCPRHRRSRASRDPRPGSAPTPAGRFVGGFGPSIDAGRVRGWTTFPVSIHPIATGPSGRRRAERLASPSPDDNRVTHGCITFRPILRADHPSDVRGGRGVLHLARYGPLAETVPEFARSRGIAQRNDGRRARAARH